MLLSLGVSREFIAARWDTGETKAAIGLDRSKIAVDLRKRVEGYALQTDYWFGTAANQLALYGCQRIVLSLSGGEEPQQKQRARAGKSKKTRTTCAGHGPVSIKASAVVINGMPNAAGLPS
jgi:hypothetical protein